MSSNSIGPPRHRFLVFALLMGLGAVLLNTAFGPKACGAAGVQPDNLVFILDASGSMGAQIQGKLKIDVAREVLSGLIRDLPAGVHVGLVAYGHRQKDDCSDVEEIAPLAPLNKDILINRITSIHPKGKTPLTASVRMVADKLKTLESDATIVLVSDGDETCQGDPCALVKELKASGVRFVLHVIGFGVGEKEKSQLTCMADAGEGSYYSASNAGELNLAARKAVEKTDQSTATLKLKAQRNGRPFRAYCEVYEALEDEEKGKERVAEGWVELTGGSFKLSPGTYDVKISNEEDANTPPVTFPGVTLQAGKILEKVADFSGGTLKMKSLRNGKPFRAYCEVFKAIEDEEKGKEKVTEGWIELEGSSFKLSPGSYDVKVFNEEDANTSPVVFPGVAVEAGKIVEKTADFSGGTLKVKSLRRGKPFRVYCEIFKTTGDEEKEKEKVTEGWVDTEGAAFKLSPGTYDVRLFNEEDSLVEKLYTGILIEAGKIQNLDAQL